MKAFKSIFLAGTLALMPAFSALAAGKIFTADFPASDKPGELKLDAMFSVWIPEGVKEVRAVIVHQHGCGADANAAGETAAQDLHWQALAAKWDAALLAPHYKQIATGREGCDVWQNPNNGSYATFLKALDQLAAKCGHAELKTAPWCLWGHSGGAYWVSLMETLAPERIVAAWLRSGTAFHAWESGEIAKPALTEAVYRIPTMLNPGIKESTDGRPIAAWLASAAMFKAYRAQGALIGFAADPLSGHDCGDSRYLAIPYFDACLELRLSGPGQPLRTLDSKKGWRAELMGRTALPVEKFVGSKTKAGVWLPNERIAKAWMEYVVTGATSDTSPPPAPTRVKASAQADGSIVIEWDAVADFESGLQGFIIERDGKPLAQVPEKPVGKFGRPLFQSMSFHDTPEQPLPEMRYVDRSTAPGEKHQYGVIAVNGVGLKSSPTLSP